MKLTLVISSLGCGGAERALSIMANYWAERGEGVTLVTLYDGEAPFYSLHPAVKRCSLGLAGASGNLAVGILRNLHRVRILRRAILESRPSVVISFMDKNNILTLLATRRLGIPVVVVEQVDPAMYSIGQFWGMLRRVSYPLADRLVSASRGVDSRFTWISARKRMVIYNPLFPEILKLNNGEVSKTPEVSRTRRLVAMGRLVPQKGFDLLLCAFRPVSAAHPEWSLTILGDGPARGELETQAASLGISGRVNMLGQISDPFSVLREADLFVLSSRFEGFGCALCEAMACGLPVVSFDCPSGPAEIIRDGVDGVLVPPEDVNALVAALDRLMGDAAERERLAKRAPEVLERFGVEKVMGMWGELLKAVVLQKRS